MMRGRDIESPCGQFYPVGLNRGLDVEDVAIYVHVCGTKSLFFLLFTVGTLARICSRGD